MVFGAIQELASGFEGCALTHTAAATTHAAHKRADQPQTTHAQHEATTSSGNTHTINDAHERQRVSRESTRNHCGALAVAGAGSSRRVSWRAMRCAARRHDDQRRSRHQATSALATTRRRATYERRCAVGGSGSPCCSAHFPHLLIRVCSGVLFCVVRCEKKVEIDFHVPAGGPDLRSIPRSAIDGFLSLAKCTVISTRNNEHFDSYLLSESSLFIFPTKILLKTCGTTLLLKSVGAILAAARAVHATPDFLQFSRSNFIFPSKQHFPHRAFSEETEYLNKLLGKEGDAFILGPLHGPRWHLYIVDFNEVDASQYKQQTCELIMFNLDPKVMKQFYQQAKDQEAAGAASSSSSAPAPMEDESKEDQIKNTSGQGYANTNGEGSRTGDEATKRSGIDLLLPGSSIDGFLFSPCGYS